MNETKYERRKIAIHLLRRGNTPEEVAAELNCSVAWVYKWRKRFFAEKDWEALHDQSHTPKAQPRKFAESVRQAIREARSELEAEAGEAAKLSYISAHAVQARLRKKKVSPLPSITSIERELRTAGMTRPYGLPEPAEIRYPCLHPTEPLELVQVDIVPHYLSGGACVACFNAIDVVSHYPTGQQSLTKRSQDAADFLLHVWHEIGIPVYTQVDNEGCFSGGFTHPRVLGRVVRLALLVGTQLVFSPFYHPESNGTVERFHQDYSKHVWDKHELLNLPTVQQHSPAFFEAYRHSEHHSALKGACPAGLHPAAPASRLPIPFLHPDPLSLTIGQVHFIRRVSPQKQVRILNVDWEVPSAQPDQGVWATLEFAACGAQLQVFDAAPDAEKRVCLVTHPFLLKEKPLPLAELFQRPIAVEEPSLFRSTVNCLVNGFLGLFSTMC